MVRDLTYYPIFGLPAVVYGGLLTLVLFLTTAYIGHAIISGKGRYSIKVHAWLARISILFALLHAFFALSAFFKY